MDKQIDVKINKCPVPIIWLDTSVLINMTKHRIDKTASRDIYRRECDLFDAVYKAVREKELIYPQGDQEEEVTRRPREFQETQSLLSLGIHFRHRSEIKETQMQIAMRAYISKSCTMETNFQDAFDSDPVFELGRVRGFIIDLYSNKSDRLMASERANKLQNLEKIRQLKESRRKVEVSFEEQLKIEYLGEYQAVSCIMRHYLNYLSGKFLPTMEELSQFYYLSCLLKQWNEFGGNPHSVEGILQFLVSEEWKSTPYNCISAHLQAKLMTRDGNIKSGDPMDISQLIIALIYCQYVICDKSMRNLIRELGLDKKYEVGVYSITDVKDVIEIIGAL